MKILQQFFSTLIDPNTFQPVEQPPQDTQAFYRYYLHPLRKLLLVTLVLAGIATATELLLYVFLGQLVDWMSTHDPATFWDHYMPELLGMLLVIALVRPISLIVSRGLIQFAVTVSLGNAIRWHNQRYVIRQSMEYFSNDFSGRIAQKAMQTGNSLRESLINVIDGLWLLLVYLVGTLWLFISMDWRLLLPIAVWGLGYSIVIWKLVPPVRKRSSKLSEANSQWLGQVVDSYTNIQSVKLFARTDQEDKHVEGFVLSHTRAFHNLMGAIFNMFISLTVLNTFLIVSIATLSIYLWQWQEISVGAIAIANAVIMRIIQMSGWILRTITALFENIGTVQNGIETIAQPNKVTDQPKAQPLVLQQAGIEFEQVNFAYQAEKGVLKDFVLSIQPGEKIGIVGRSGAGKSTLVNLLLRFYDVDSGMIRIDQQDIAAVTQDSLRQHIGMVTQDTSLLHRSVRDNIRYGRSDASEADILQAAAMAGVTDFIDQLADPHGNAGLDALVGERGVKLSGGQRQRIAIARVILKDAPILILDEATSALDSEVEAAIQSRLQTLMQGKTVLAIAHRLSTIAALDRLIVLDEGHIIEQGTHQELLALDGLYANLWKRQSGGFLGQD